MCICEHKKTEYSSLGARSLYHLWFKVSTFAALRFTENYEDRSKARKLSLLECRYLQISSPDNAEKEFFVVLRWFLF